MDLFTHSKKIIMFKTTFSTMKTILITIVRKVDFIRKIFIFFVLIVQFRSMLLIVLEVKMMSLSLTNQYHL
jgi:hypothetical protein